MRDYELALIFNPKLESKEKEALLAKIKEEIEKGKGKIKKTEEWGKKDLVYPIERFGEGVFFLLQIELSPESVLSLDKKIRNEEKIIRHLLVKVENGKRGGDKKKSGIEKSE